MGATLKTVRDSWRVIVSFGQLFLFQDKMLAALAADCIFLLLFPKCHTLQEITSHFILFGLTHIVSIFSSPFIYDFSHLIYGMITLKFHYIICGRMAQKSKKLDDIVSEELNSAEPIAQPENIAEPAAEQPVTKPIQKKRGAVSPFDGLMDENTYAPFPLSNEDAWIQYSDSEHQVVIRWDPYSDAQLYVQMLAKNIDVETNPQVFRQGFDITGPGRWLAGYSATADNITSINPELDSLSIDELTLKFNDPEDTNYYVLPFGKLSEEGRPVNVLCDRGQLRAVALYYKGENNKGDNPDGDGQKNDKRHSPKFRAGLGLNIAPIVRSVGKQKEVTGWITKVGSKNASGYAIIAAPDKTQINMVSPGGAVETVKGQVHAYTDNLELKVLGVGAEWALTSVLTLAGGAAGLALTPIIMASPIASAATGFAAGGYATNLMLSRGENIQLKDYLKQIGYSGVGGGVGAAINYFGNTTETPLFMSGLLVADGMLIGHLLGRLISAAAVNPENMSLMKRLGAAVYLTEDKLHALAMKNNSEDYGFCITS